MFDNQTAGGPAAMSDTPFIEPEFSEKLAGLFEPKRYKVLYGGRAAGRSWGVARALLILGRQKALRVLCARELQNSIAESVHKLLSDQIDELRMHDFYVVEKARIYSRFTGTEFFFEGIKNNTLKIKSFEGIDICWVEEANKVSKTSWMILIPTIRKVGSEIWLTFNPDLATDYTYRRFVMRADPKRSFVVGMTWRDNPWISQELLEEKDSLKAEDYDEYLNVWEGKPRQNVQGAVFAKELRKALEEGRVCTVPWERDVPVDTYWDLGRHDLTCIWFAQRVAMQYRILGYYENKLEDIHHYLQECQRRAYTYGTMYLPHDAEHQRLGMHRSIKQIVQSVYPDTRVVSRINKKVNGINAARMIFPSCWFDEEGCEEGLDRLRHYKYEVKEGQFSTEPLHDEASNAADAFMTLAQSIKGAKKKAGKVIEALESVQIERQEALAGRVNNSLRGIIVPGAQGWMR